MFVLHASQKYMVSCLTDRCIQYLEQHLTISTAHTLLEQSIFFDAYELKTKVLKKISEETSAFLADKAFISLSKNSLQQILKLDEVNATELDVFSACVRWAKKQCKKKTVTGNMIREILGENLFLIRFPTMSLEDFNEKVLTKEILLDGEGFLLYRHITSKNNETTEKCGPFDARPRDQSSKLKILMFPGPYIETRTLQNQAFGAKVYLFPKSMHPGQTNATLYCKTGQSVRLKRLFIHKYVKQAVPANVQGQQAAKGVSYSIHIVQNGINVSVMQNITMDVQGSGNIPSHYALEMNDVTVNAGEFSISISGLGTQQYSNWQTTINDDCVTISGKQLQQPPGLSLMQNLALQEQQAQWTSFTPTAPSSGSPFLGIEYQVTK